MWDTDLWEHWLAEQGQLKHPNIEAAFAKRQRFEGQEMWEDLGLGLMWTPERCSGSAMGPG